MQAKKIHRFLGLHNRMRSRKGKKGEFSELISLAVARNINIDDEGAVSSRDGYVESLVLGNVTAAFSMSHNRHAYVVSDGVLYRVNTDLSTIQLGSVGNQPVQWLEVGTRVFMSTGFIIDNDKLIPWAVQPPSDPVVTVTSGLLPAGQYQLLVTRIFPDGRESASSGVVALNLADDSGLDLTGIVGCMVYMTDTNGSVFYEIGYQVNYIGAVADGGKSINQDLILNGTLPEDVRQIAFYQGSLYCSTYDKTNDLSAIFFSCYMRFHVFDYDSNVISDIAGEIRLLHGMDNGLLIGTDRAIYLYADESLSKLAGYGVPIGKQLIVNRDGNVFFQSVRGVCTLPFQNLTEDNFTMPLGGECVTGIINTEGFESFVTITDGTGVAEDSMTF
jgi:hypothetical protein